MIHRSRDPLSAACAPPVNETPKQRAVREAKEAEARRVSESIDEQLRLENQRKNPSVKVLLLGQEGSGKSALIKAFLELYAPQAWEEDRLLSRAVVYLDLIRSVDKILDLLEHSPDTPHWVKLLRMRLIPLCATQRDLDAELALARAYAAATIAPEQKNVKQRQDHRPGRRSISERATELMVTFRSDIAALWKDDDVWDGLEMHQSQLDEHCQFDEDVVRVRTRMMPGVQEYHFWPETGQEVGHEWIFYDIGCSRSRRPIWLPYLTDMNAIVFYADISTFDQHLEEEDPSENQFQQSFSVWTKLCKSRLIPKVPLILVLAGCDLFQEKLEQGVPLGEFITWYGDRANDMRTATNYIRDEFLTVARKNSPEPRAVHTYLTNSSDSYIGLVTRTVSSIRESNLGDNPRKLNIIS